MATAKQIAWRKKFAAMAKAGTLRKGKRRAKATTSKRRKRATGSPSPAQLRARRQFAAMAKARAKAARAKNPRGKHLPGLSPKLQRMYEHVLKATGSKRIAAATTQKAARTNPLRSASRPRTQHQADHWAKELDHFLSKKPSTIKTKAQAEIVAKNLDNWIKESLRKNPSLFGLLKRKARVGARRTQRGRRRVAPVGRSRTVRGDSSKRGLWSVQKRKHNSVTLIKRAKRVVVKNRTRHLNPKRGFNAFRGRPVRNHISTFAANGTPRDLKECGKMVDLKLAGGKTVRFPGGNARLCHKGNRLYLTGARFRKPNPPGEVDYGEIARICYHADKPHLEHDTKARPYEHKFGEDGGIRPHLVIDAEGLPIISGGSYRVTPEGIVD